MNVSNLVLHKGGDSLSVCLNTIAILFLCEVDNILFSVGLPEHVRTRVEEAGRVELAKAQAVRLAQAKQLYGCLVVACVLGSVVVSSMVVVFLCPFLVVWVGGVLETSTAARSGTEAAKWIATVTLNSLIGFGTVLWVVLHGLDSS